MTTPPHEDRREIDRRPVITGDNPAQDLTARVLVSVQELLTRFANSVRDELQEIRADAVAERVAGQTAMEEQIRALAAAMERSQQSNNEFRNTVKSVVDDRLGAVNAQLQRRYDDMDARIGRMGDEIHLSLAAKVEEVARPLNQRLADDQAIVSQRVDELAGGLRRFDEQAGSLVQHVNEVTTALERRLDEVVLDVSGRSEERLGNLAMRMDEISAVLARQQSEVSNIVGRRVEDAELRMNERMEAAEHRLGEDIGTKVATMDATLGRVSAGLDEAITSLSQRLSNIDAHFIQIDERMEALRNEMASVDQEAIDELKEKMSSVAGESMLVRIEMERLEKSADEKIDRVQVRLNEVETALNDTTMDVSTAIQLERLEELERAIIELDPRQFVKREELARAAQKKVAPNGTMGPESLMNPAPVSVD